MHALLIFVKVYNSEYLESFNIVKKHVQVIMIIIYTFGSILSKYR